MNTLSGGATLSKLILPLSEKGLVCSKRGAFFFLSEQSPFQGEQILSF